MSKYISHSYNFWTLTRNSIEEMEKQGNKNYVYLPPDEDLAIYHDKNIEKQLETNKRYNTDFTEDENKGFKLPQ